MNKIYRLVWNSAQKNWVVASEFSAVKGKGKSSAHRVLLRAGNIAKAFTTALAMIPVISFADIAVTGDVNQSNPTNPSWAIPDSLIVGNVTSGTLTVSNGGSLTSGISATNSNYIGKVAGSTGQVNIIGQGSQWTTNGGLVIGNFGNGSLRILDGGVVTSQSNADIGANNTASGYVEVSGKDSRWSINDGLEMEGHNSTMLISNGAVVTSGYTYMDADVGLVNVTGSGSRWDNKSSLIVALFQGNDDTINITDGAVVTNSSALVGLNNNATGRINVSGPGSTWQNSSYLLLGASGGHGVMTVSNGGSVTSVNSSLGEKTGSQGEVLVTGAGSSWKDADSINIGSWYGTGSVTVNDGALVESNAINITKSQTATGVLNIGSAAGVAATAAGNIISPTITLGEGDSSIVFNHTNADYQFNPLIDGQGKVSIYSGTTVLNALNTYAGTTTIDGGVLRAGTSSAFSAASDYDVHSAGQLDLAGYDQTLANLHNAGLVSFNGAPGTVLTITGDYTGNDGFLNFNTALNDDNSATDKLLVEGNTLGTTYVSVTNIGGSGAATLNGIELVQVNGLSDGEFVKNGRIVAGAYDYSLVRGADANAGNWYLTSSAIPADDPVKPLPPPPVPPVPPVPPIVPISPVEPRTSANPAASPQLERPEAGGYAANLSAANNLFVTTLHDRLGETQYIDALTGEKKVTSMWMRNEGGHTQSHDSYGQLGTQANRYVLQLGGDIAQWSNDGQDRLHLGIMVGYGNSQSKTESHLSGYSANAAVDGYSTGVYGTWYANETDKSGLYVDSWAQYSWFNNTVDGQDLNSEEYKSKGVTASIESGYTFKIGENSAKNATYFIQPKAQAIWMGVKADDHKETNGTNVSGEGDGNIQTRLGIRAFMNGYSDQDKGKDRVFQPFVEANWIHNTKDFGTIMDTVTVNQAGTANIAELKVGVEGQINKKLNIWGNVGQQVGSKSYSDTNVMLGVKYNF
ncbi:autotransporter outer membrane beta-barrel domain-containing protein [Yersinia proxima]|uniref:autotransporter outer membrane beta-barrel domain-containing protein n=1 Tax=Yersinia proxima TaxID=2890316 RepID=UPI001D0FA2CC|nr:autotransporter outer membrane beta-barrel domain-containing protein [Yersinia proxima]